MSRGKGKYYIKEGPLGYEKDTGLSSDSRQAAEELGKAMLAVKKGTNWGVTVYVKMYHPARAGLRREQFTKNIWMSSTW